MMIELKGVTKLYGDGGISATLGDIDLLVDMSEFVAVLHRPCSRKTTLFEVIGAEPSPW